MSDTKETRSQDRQLPFQLQYDAGKGECTIDEDCVILVEQKRLGRSKTKMLISDISTVDYHEADEGDTIILKSHTGNAFKIGPIDKETGKRTREVLGQVRGENA